MRLPCGNDTARGGSGPCVRCISVWWGAVRWRSGSISRSSTACNDKAALVAVCDRVEERARAAQQRFGARTYYTDLERFLRESDAEIVVNLTPHKAHMPVSMAALEAGRHVYTEKPLAQSVDDATQLSKRHARITSNSPVPPSRCCCRPRSAGSTYCARGRLVT